MTKADNQATKSKTVKKVGVATFGKTFVLALPGMNGSGIAVSFQLITLHYEDVKHHSGSGHKVDLPSDSQPPHSGHGQCWVRRYAQRLEQYAGDTAGRLGQYVHCCHVKVSTWVSRQSKYMGVTSNYMPSIQVVNGNKEQTVQVVIASSISSGFTVVFKGMTYTDVAKLPVTLNSYEGLSLEQCSDPTSSHSSLTGTLIKSEMPVGVICGNCLNELQSAQSNCPTDASLEMPLSISNYGKIFLTFKLSLGYARGYNVISASQNATEVKVFKSRGYKVTTVLESQHYIAYSPSSVNIGEMKEPRVIVADKPIQVVLFLNSSCYVTTEFRIIAMAVLTPFGLFMDNYYWTSRLEHGYERVVVISSAAKLLNVSFDHSRIDTLPHFSKHTISQNSIAEFDSVPGPHVLYSTVSHRYGAYVYGYMREAASRVFIYPAGFVSMAGRPVSCDSDNISHIDGDLVDNDCDMRVDEEESSKIDNDYDGLAHEDEGSYHLVHGSWSFWTTWQCESKSANRATRVRYCNNPPPRNGGLYCKGSENETQSANCSAFNRDVVDGGWLVINRTCQTCSNGSGMAHIHRMCIDPPPSEGGKQCDGDYIIYGPDDYCTVVLLCKPREDTGVDIFTDTGVDICTDTGVDICTDTGVDICTDTGVDIFTDTGVDICTDTGVDICTDTGVDICTDTGIDICTDTGIDICTDTGVDICTDTGVDIFTDTGVDIFTDTGVDICTDTGVDICTDTGVDICTDTGIDICTDTGVDICTDTGIDICTDTGIDICTDTGIDICTDTGIDICTDTGVDICTDTGIDICTDTGIDICTDTGIDICTDTGVDICTDTGIDICTDTGIDICNDTGIYFCTDNGIDICTDPGIDICTDTGIDICTDTGIDICTYTGIDICTDTGIDICTDNGIDICTDPGIDICTDTGIDICTDTGIDICTDTGIDICTDPGIAICTYTGIDICTDNGIDICNDTGTDTWTDTWADTWTDYRTKMGPAITTDACADILTA
ncbi:hypothetical protein Btru_014819 [Bulinus truncatus]|nr:hypothetical protein Btru_014819 [Bulinus truncatus]